MMTYCILPIGFLDEYSQLREFISSRYPYLFIDEFQDTTPAQTQIIEWLSRQGSVVGVIGDPEQSIYGFTGAKPQHFAALEIDGCVDYVIRGNQRSPRSVVHLLNVMRRDGLEQEALADGETPPVVLHVGLPGVVLSEIDKNRPAGWSHAVLFRTNSGVRAARLGSLENHAVDHWRRLASEEADSTRQRFIRNLAEAHAYSQRRRIGDAIRVLSRGLKRLIQSQSPSLLDHHARHLALTLIEHLLGSAYNREASLFTVYSGVLETMASVTSRLGLSKYGKGKARAFAERTKYAELVATADVVDVHHEIRTIHSAKGAEFDSVLVWLDPENLQRLLHKDRLVESSRVNNEDEERRVLYVAMSRARKALRLGTTGPLSDGELALARELKIEVVEIPQSS